MSKFLNDIKQNPEFLKIYNEGMSLLYKSGIFNYLHERGRARIIGYGADVQTMATQAARSAGYNEALEDILSFREKYLDPAALEEKNTPTYGGLEFALSRGDLTEEEVNELRQRRTSP